MILKMNFNEIISKAKSEPAKTMVVAAAEDPDVLSAVFDAYKENLAFSILIGDEAKIRLIAEAQGYSLDNMRLIDEKVPAAAAELAVKMIASGQAQVLMKGLLQTSVLLHAILNKEWGMRTGGLLNHVGIIESPRMDRLIYVCDGAMVMYPDIRQKVDIINNTVRIVRGLGVETPKVACISAVEVVNTDMPATMDAAILAMMSQRGQIKNCLVDGPLALDNAISPEAAAHKGVQSSSPVLGRADILLVPNIETGNAILKCARNLGGCNTAGLLAGASAPVVMTSRADSAANKLRSIACAAVASSRK